METVTKTRVVKDKDTGKSKKVEVKYSVGAEFVPTSSMDVCAEFIENYCVANKKTEWLVKEVNKTVTDKNGKKKDIGFVSIRSDFMKEFFPTVGKKGASNSFKDRVNAKYGKKK